jgi:hypothetical protein
MNVLKKGSKGEQVGDWQMFLRGVGLYYSAIDNDFGDITETSTKSFQRNNGLTADGIVGNKTMKKAIELGYNEYSDENDEFIHSPNYPAKPNFLPITGNANREKLFGKFSYKASPNGNNPEQITITDDWDDKNIVRVKLPALSKATNGKYTAMLWHKSCEHQLVKLFETWEKENLHTQILSYAGAFYPRFIRGSKTQLSNHSWGTAFDINVPYNGLNQVPALVGQKGCVRELVEIANEWGFYWGGHFTRKDGMHFEIAKIL